MTAAPYDARSLEAALRLFNKAAREHSWAFVERVFRDEVTGLLVENDPTQDEWHELADEYDRLIIMAFPESGKTTSIIVGRALWELGNDTSLRMLFLSKTFGQSTRITSALRELIDTNEVVHEIFPNLKPGKNKKWTDSEFTVERAVHGKNPSVKAVGMESSFMGVRADRLYVDDLEDDATTRKPSSRKETLRFVDKTVLNRLTSRGRVIWTTNDWHPKAACQVLAQRRRWHLVKYSVVSKRTGVPLFPKRFPQERVDEIRADMHPLLFSQLYMNESRDETSGQFKEEYVDKCKDLGRGMTFVHSMTREETPPGAIIVAGVDLATGRKESRHSDHTAFHIAMIGYDLHRTVLSVEGGIMSGPEILLHLAQLRVRYPDIACMVEDNGAQIYLLQFAEVLEKDGLELPPLYPWTTTQHTKWNKAFGVASLAVEMERGMWTYPSEEPTPRCASSELRCPDELEALCQEELDFTADGAHTGDNLMAKWFARELARKFCGDARPKKDEKPQEKQKSQARSGGGF